jgi:heme-degrading monooxygenase HmoA
MAPRKPQIGRLWHGRTTFANAHPYQEHLRRETLPGLTAIDGFQGAYVLKHVGSDAVEFLVLTLWASEDAIHAFAGPDATLAVIPAAAEQLLEQWDERATHYEVVLASLDLLWSGTAHSVPASLVERARGEPESTRRATDLLESPRHSG